MLGNNETPFAAIGFEQMHRDGQRMAVAAVRASYELHPDGTLTAAGRQALVLSDVYDGSPATAPLLAASDLVPFKPAADVTVLGEAHAPDAEALSAWAAGVKVGDRAHVLRVHGARQWEPRGGRFVLGPATPCTRAPIDWRAASGGRHIGDPKGNVDPRNPVGPGLIDAKYTSPLHAYDAPQVDSEEHPVADPLGRPEPQGFGPVPPHWAWRSRHAGTFDPAWHDARAPRLPADFDYRFHQCAHPALATPDYLRPGTRIVLGRLAAGAGQLSLQLPDVEPFAHFRWTDGREVFARLNRDGVHIDLRGEPPWPVAITFRCWIEACPQLYKVDVGLTDEQGARGLPAAGLHGLAEARA